jgi:hypothetical protein
VHAVASIVFSAGRSASVRVVAVPPTVLGGEATV